MKKILLIPCILWLNACSDPNAATEDNFKAAIENDFSENKACIKINTDFPETVIKPDPNKRNSFTTDKTPLFNEFVKYGLLNAEQTEMKKSSFFGKPVTYPAIRYSLTVQGKESMKDANYNKDKGYPEFCYAKFEVIDIENFTLPNDSEKQISSSLVDYSFKLSDIEEWANSEIIASNFREIKLFVHSKKEIFNASLTVQLTNNGWIVSGHNGMR